MTQQVDERGVGERYDDATALGRVGRRVEIWLDDGQVLHGTIETEDEATGSELTAVLSLLSTEPYVQFGDTIVRAQDVRAIQLKEPRTTNQGGNRMATMDRERSGDTTFTSRPMMGRRGWADREWGETKGSPKTTELIAYLLSVLAVAITTAVFDNLDVWRGMLLITVLTGAYLFSRGLAKSGSRHSEGDD